MDDVGGKVDLQSGAIDWSCSLTLMFGLVDTLSYRARGWMSHGVRLRCIKNVQIMYLWSQFSLSYETFHPYKLSYLHECVKATLI